MPPSLTKRHDGIYIIRFRDSTGREHSRSTGCRKKCEALIFLHAFHVPGQGVGVTVREFSNAYLAFSKAEHNPSTHQLIKDILKPFLVWVGERLLSEISPAQMDEYRHSLGKDKRPATVLLHLRQLKAMFTYATQREYLPANPMRYEKNLYIKTVSCARVRIEDFGKLLSGLKTKWHRDIVTLAILTGLRRQELLDLLWTDVNLSERLLHVRHGKGDKQRWVPLQRASALCPGGYGPNNGARVRNADRTFTVTSRRLAPLRQGQEAREDHFGRPLPQPAPCICHTGLGQRCTGAGRAEDHGTCLHHDNHGLHSPGLARHARCRGQAAKPQARHRRLVISIPWGWSFAPERRSLAGWHVDTPPSPRASCAAQLSAPGANAWCWAPLDPS
jgi:hypothetical protein